MASTTAVFRQRAEVKQRGSLDEFKIRKLIFDNSDKNRVKTENEYVHVPVGKGLIISHYYSFLRKQIFI